MEQAINIILVVFAAIISIAAGIGVALAFFKPKSNGSHSLPKSYDTSGHYNHTHKPI